MLLLWFKFTNLLKHRIFCCYCTKIKQNFNNNNNNNSNNNLLALQQPPWSVLFFGTDEFSLYSLRALNEEYRNGSSIKKLDVVTTIKGNNNKQSNPVKHFSDKFNLHVYRWPININDLNDHYDIGLVVSFGHLIPEELINKFHFGILNVHASLLPRWRGAAPIIYALANGDTCTGVTIMRIKPKLFDIGDIVLQKKIEINNNIKQPELYEKLGKLGADQLIQTIKTLPKCLDEARQQPTIGISYAPKINQNFARIHWKTMSSKQIYNLDRALTNIYNLTAMWKSINVKFVQIEEDNDDNNNNEEILKKHPNIQPGFVYYDRRQQCLKVYCKDSKFIKIHKIRLTGKKLMDAKDFNNGYLCKESILNRYFK